MTMILVGGTSVVVISKQEGACAAASMFNLRCWAEINISGSKAQTLQLAVHYVLYRLLQA